MGADAAGAGVAGATPALRAEGCGAFIDLPEFACCAALEFGENDPIVRRSSSFCSRISQRVRSPTPFLTALLIRKPNHFVE
jgi:hypothetical protein